MVEVREEPGELGSRRLVQENKSKPLLTPRCCGYQQTRPSLVNSNEKRHAVTPSAELPRTKAKVARISLHSTRILAMTNSDEAGTISPWASLRVPVV